MAIIYISSTYGDLKDARRKVYDSLRTMDHDVRAMEDYVAADKRPLDKCLADIAKCDIYVGIFAWRYGFIPPGRTRSITELEYREAKRLKKPCLCFLLSEEASWPRQLMDEDAEKIKKLRKEVAEHLICKFNNADELAGHVLASVERTLLDDNPTSRYVIARGVIPYRDYFQNKIGSKNLVIQKVEHISDLRIKLLHQKPLQRPMLITVRGTLFPCALLSSGWWDREGKAEIVKIDWRNDIQEWLFNGFDLWAPSWDFCWNLDKPEGRVKRPYYIAQLGSGDESDSLPVLIPQHFASIVRHKFLDSWGGLEVSVTGMLGRRNHFKGEFGGLELFGGLLDYCLWLDPHNKKHNILVEKSRTEVYSGYLWKCLAPKKWSPQGAKRGLSDVYFIWEHTNFAKKDAVKYNLDGLLHKESFIKSLDGDLELLAKSSWLVPGNPKWTPQQIYQRLLERECISAGDS